MYSHVVLVCTTSEGGPLLHIHCVCIFSFFLRFDEGSSKGIRNKVWGMDWWTETTSPSLTQHLDMSHAKIWEIWGASAESEGAAVAKRESYEGGGSKGKDGVGGSVFKLGHRWVLGLGNGV